MHIVHDCNCLDIGEAQDVVTERVGLGVVVDTQHVLVDVQGVHEPVDGVAEDPILRFQPGDNFRHEGINLTLAGLATTIEVLEGPLRNEDRQTEGGVPKCAVVLQLLGGGIVPVNDGYIPIAVATALIFESFNPSKSVGVRRSNRGAESLALVPERGHNFLPERNAFLRAHVRLTTLIGLVKTQIKLIITILGEVDELLFILGAPELRVIRDIILVRLGRLIGLPVVEPREVLVIFEIGRVISPSETKLLPSSKCRGTG